MLRASTLNMSKSGKRTIVALENSPLEVPKYYVVRSTTVLPEYVEVQFCTVERRTTPKYSGRLPDEDLDEASTPAIPISHYSLQFDIGTSVMNTSSRTYYSETT
jgi:hypothetical protein